MDYKEQAALIRGFAYEYNKCSCITKIGGMKPEEFLLITATAITDLLSRAEAAEARLRELVEADREGRCVVLPCKIGDTLYRIQRFKRGKNWRKEAEYIRTVELNKNNFWRVVFEGELGETVFLTREAAEAALKGEQHEQNL